MGAPEALRGKRRRYPPCAECAKSGDPFVVLPAISKLGPPAYGNVTTSHSRRLNRNVRIIDNSTQDCETRRPLLRIFLRIVVIGPLSVVLTLLVWWTSNGLSTIGGAAVPILSNDPRSLGEVLGISMAVDLLVSFGFLFGIWFLWTQGRNLARERERSTLRAGRLRIGGIPVVATLCALPLSFYVMLLRSKFHSGLADTPAEVMESFILSLTACAIALCGIAILGRFWPSASPDPPRTLP